MRRRIAGRPYRLDFPEYHVDCGNSDCDARILLTESGQAWSSQEAEARAKREGPYDVYGDGWSRQRGRWYCPIHKEHTKN